uniref:Ovule protein n=1 Tax=Schistosoma curassoni TaxID=6186 RepID=A0A183KNM9_9TREM
MENWLIIGLLLPKVSNPTILQKYVFTGLPLSFGSFSSDITSLCNTRTPNSYCVAGSKSRRIISKCSS